MEPEQAWQTHTETLGAFIRAHRRMADLSLREMATLTHVSNAYLSQIERGLHQPSMRVLSAIADALEVPAGTLLAEAGLFPHPPGAGCADERPDATTRGAGDHLCSTESAIRVDPRLTDAQREALLGVYRSFTFEGD